MSDRDAVVPDWGEVRALCNAATEGPWRTDGVMHDVAEDGHPVLGGGEPGSMSEHMVAWVGEFCNRNASADAELITAARTVLPAALDEIERQRAARDRVLALCDEWEAQPNDTPRHIDGKLRAARVRGAIADPEKP